MPVSFSAELSILIELLPFHFVYLCVSRSSGCSLVVHPGIDLIAQILFALLNEMNLGCRGTFRWSALNDVWTLWIHRRFLVSLGFLLLAQFSRDPCRLYRFHASSQVGLFLSLLFSFLLPDLNHFRYAPLGWRSWPLSLQPCQLLRSSSACLEETSLNGFESLYRWSLRFDLCTY